MSLGCKTKSHLSPAPLEARVQPKWLLGRAVMHTLWGLLALLASERTPLKHAFKTQSRNDLQPRKHAYVSHMLDTPPETGASSAETRHVEQSKLAITWWRRFLDSTMEESSRANLHFSRTLSSARLGEHFQDESSGDAFLGDLVDPSLP